MCLAWAPVALGTDESLPEEIEVTMDNATRIVDRLCSDIKDEASKIVEDSDATPVIAYKAEKIEKRAESCLETVRKTEFVMPKIADILDEEIDFFEDGETNASEVLQNGILAVDRIGLLIYTKLQSDFDNFKALSKEIVALAEIEELDDVIGIARAIEIRADFLETVYHKFDQDLDTSVEQIEEILPNSEE